MEGEKKCSGCKIVKPHDKFSKDDSKTDGLQDKCKECRNKLDYFNPDLDPKTTLKLCNGPCKEEKPLVEYKRTKTGRFGFANMCKSCTKITQKEKAEKNKNPDMEGTKICNGILCQGEELPKTSFNYDSYNKDGLQCVCKKCQLRKTQETYSKFDSFIKYLLNGCKRRVEKKAKNGRILEYSITLEDVIELYNKQNGLCFLSDLVMTHNAINDRKEDDEHILNKYNISIDRIDNAIGYTKTNIRLVCAIYNRMRMDRTDKEFIELCHKVVNKVNTKEKKNANNNIDDIINSKAFLDCVKYKIDSATYNAEQRDLPFNLSKEDVIEVFKKQKGICALTGEKMSYIKKKNDALSLSIDRIDSTKGYNKKNIHLCTEKANEMKSDLSSFDFTRLCKIIDDKYNKKN
jgi:hypothetical protein